MEIQKTSNSQSDLEKEEWNWRNQPIGSFNREILETTISQPEGQTALYVIAIGVPDESPVLERIEADGDTKYYLDEADVLHVPKYTVDAATRFI